MANVLDSHTADLGMKIRDTVGALRRRCLKVMQVELAMSVKIKTMLEQSMAALSIQSQPVALLKTRLTQDLIPQKKQD